MTGRIGVSWKSTVPHGNGKRPDLIVRGLRNHFVYWFYNDIGEVSYVGCTRRPDERWREHLKSGRSRTVAHKYMSGPYDYPTARRIERAEQKKHGCRNGGPLK